LNLPEAISKDLERKLPVETNPMPSRQLPSPFFFGPKILSDVPSKSPGAPVTFPETIDRVPSTTPLPIQGELTPAIEPPTVPRPRIETISPKISPTDVKPEPKPIVVMTAEPSTPEALVREATQREANLVASYLAEGTRDRGETSPIATLKMQFSANGFGAESHQSEPKQKAPAVNNEIGSAEFQPIRMTPAGSVVNKPDSPVAQAATQIVELAEVTPPKQSKTVRLRLRPEELGQVDVQLSRDAQGRISAQLTVEHETARTMLAQSLEQLRDSLQRAGLDVDRLQVRAEVSSFSSGHSSDPRAQEESRGVYPQSSPGNSSSSTETHAQQVKRVNDHKLISLSA
jgi:hypothetical protein